MRHRASTCRRSSTSSTRSPSAIRSRPSTATGGRRLPARSGISPATPSHSTRGQMALALSNSLITAGEVAERQGNYLEARGAFEAALENLDPLVVANAHACLGRLAWQQGAYEASFTSFEKARAIAARLDAADVKARAEIGLGNVYYARGDYVRARDMYD